MGSRKRGRPPTRWIDDIENDLKTLNIKNWQRVAAYRWNWRKRAMDVAKTCNRYDLTNTVQPLTMKIGMYMYLLKRRVLCYLLYSAPHQVVVQHINFCTDQSFAKLPT
ncbi:hypothetical protein TNCV_4755231 [Trichonephila clavipes]|nr:hypothetical protein TNCV_4755231 [Trichonephila clavipes]